MVPADGVGISGTVWSSLTTNLPIRKSRAAYMLATSQCPTASPPLLESIATWVDDFEENLSTRGWSVFAFLGQEGYADGDETGCSVHAHPLARASRLAADALPGLSLDVAEADLRRDGLAEAVASRPSSSSQAKLCDRTEALGLRDLYSSLFLEDGSARSSSAPPEEGSRGRRISRAQSRKWADRRVHEGVAKAKAGDQTGALEHYAAALELFPAHREGLVGKGAALANLGKFKESLRAFEAALKLDPEDANARRYRDIALSRLEGGKQAPHQSRAGHVRGPDERFATSSTCSSVKRRRS